MGDRPCKACHCKEKKEKSNINTPIKELGDRNDHQQEQNLADNEVVESSVQIHPLKTRRRKSAGDFPEFDSLMSDGQKGI